MELIWGLLLAASSLSSRARPLALLLSVKWAASYFSAGLGVWLGPAVIDILLAASVMLMAVRLGGKAGAIIAFDHVFVLIAHGWHWTLWDQGHYAGVQYFNALLWLHTATYFALCWSVRREVQSIVVGWLDWCREFGLGCLVGLFPAPRHRVGWSRRPRR